MACPEALLENVGYERSRNIRVQDPQLLLSNGSVNFRLPGSRFVGCPLGAAAAAPRNDALKSARLMDSRGRESAHHDDNNDRAGRKVRRRSEERRVGKEGRTGWSQYPR